MADSKDYFDLTLVTPSGTREEFNVRHIRAPGAEGYFGVLADHLPFITTIKTGEIDIDTKDGKKILGDFRWLRRSSRESSNYSCRNSRAC